MPAPRRTRDFRLTAERAEKLRGTAFDRFLRRLAMPNLGLLRPVAGVGVALGLVIAAVGGVPGAYLASSAGAPPPAAVRDLSATPTQNQDTHGQAGVASATNGESTGDTGAEGPVGTPLPAAYPTGSAKNGQTDSMYLTMSPTARATATFGAALVPSPTATEGLINGNGPAPTSPNVADTGADIGRLLLVYAGLTLAIVAFGLLLLSIYARRRNEDPLLR